MFNGFGYPSRDLMFVYGSLKQGYWNNSVLGDSKFLGEFITAKGGHMVDVGFPYLVFGDEIPISPWEFPTHDSIAPYRSHCAKGELFYVPDSEIKLRLDRLEGQGSHYKRRNIVVSSCDLMGYDNDVEATVYTPVDSISVLTNRAASKEEYKHRTVWNWKGK